MNTGKFAAAAKALGVSIALIGAGGALAAPQQPWPANALTGVLESPDRVSFSYINNSGFSSGLLSFDLLGYRTLDGDFYRFTDLFELSVNGKETMYGVFALGGNGSSDAWLDDKNRGGASGLTWSVFSPGYGLGGIASVSLTIPLLAGDNTIKFRYYSELPQGKKDEGWGVGSFQVTPVPEPGTWAMLLAGLGLTGAMARRRRTA